MAHTSRLAAAGAIKAAMEDIFATDASGNVTGLETPDGIIRTGLPNNIVADGVELRDVTTTNSATSTITSASAAFTSADVNKKCVIISYASKANTRVYGYISSFISSTSVVCTVNATPGVLSNAIMVYGSDDTAAINAAITDVTASRGTVWLPKGIMVCTSAVTIPDGVTVIGTGRTITGNYAKNFYYSGSSLVLANYIASGGFVTVGNNASSGIYGALLSDCNVDGMKLAIDYVVGNGGRTGSMERLTVIRGHSSAGTTYVVSLGAGGKLLNCIIIGQQDGHVVSMSGDSKAINNQVFGAGNGYYGFKISAADDVLVSQNHIWKDADDATSLGGSVYIENWGNNVLRGGITIQGNKFDTAFGPHVQITTLAGAAGSTALRGVSILNNISMNNDAVTANTYAFIKLDISAEDVLRGLVVSGNLVRGSWNDTTKGGHKYFIDGSGILGAVYGKVVAGNFIDNLGTAAYTGFTPDIGVNQNASMATGSTVVTAF